MAIYYRCAAHAAIFCLLTLAGPLPVFAADTETGSKTVTLKDLDLTKAAGQAQAHLRIARAAHAVCDADDIRNIRQSAGAASCREEAIRVASARLETLVAAAGGGMRVAAAGN
jgi:UrcA family protein